MHDPANDLFDRACALLESAQLLRHAAERPGSEQALTGTLGCLQAALHELADACATLERRVGPAVVGSVAAGQIGASLGVLTDRLDDVDRVCGAARAESARATILPPRRHRSQTT